MQRRTLLRAATAGAAAAAVSAPAPARAWAPPKPPSETTQARRLAVRERLTPTPAKHHLLLRTTYGITPALLAELDARGTRGWLDDQLTPERIDDGACDQIVARFPLASATPPELYRALDNGSWDGMRDVSSMTLARATWSKRQLFEVMVEFWSNHLNVTCPSSEVWSSRGSYDRDVIRKHALGTFSDLLVASCTHPAMLQYLDNLESRGANPNENYGREVLELHTVGRDAGYGQAGVVDSARAFTGLTVWNPWNGGTDTTYGTLRYRADWHYVGPLRVLGWLHPNADRTQGVQVATSLARYLAAHPATAARLAHKLAVRFVSDSPPPALVDRLARIYLDSGTAIVPVLRRCSPARSSPRALARSTAGRTRTSSRRCAPWASRRPATPRPGPSPGSSGSSGRSVTPRSPGTRPTGIRTSPPPGPAPVPFSDGGTCTSVSRRAGGRTGWPIRVRRCSTGCCRDHVRRPAPTW